MTIDPPESALAALIAQITAGLAALPAGQEGHVLTLETDADDRCWVQVSDDLINAGWPFEHGPEPLFVAVCETSLVDFQPGLFATFAIPDTSIEARARWIAHYFVEILGLDTAAALTVTMEDHGP
jgi:hypothetical protein